MKKILITLFTLLILVGCTAQKGYSQLSNGTDVLFKTPDGEYTKNDLYKSLKVNSEQAIENDILNKIATKLNVDLADVEKEADDMIEMYKELGYESAIYAYYGSIESFKQMYMTSGVLKKLSEIYIEDNFDKLVEEDKPVKMQMVHFEDEESANNFVNDVNSGSTFETAAINAGYDTECPLSVYLDSDELPIELKSYLNTTTENGLSSIITVTNTTSDSEGNPSTNSTYYVLNISSRDVNEFIDDYKATKLESVDAIAVKEYMFSTHDIKFYDQDIYEIMKTQYEVLQ